MDGIPLPCETEEGCLFPALRERSQRVLIIHSHLLAMRRLNVGGEVLRMYGATLDDLASIAAIETELTAGGGGDHGDGPEMDAEC